MAFKDLRNLYLISYDDGEFIVLYDLYYSILEAFSSLRTSGRRRRAISSWMLKVANVIFRRELSFRRQELFCISGTEIESIVFSQ